MYRRSKNVHASHIQFHKSMMNTLTVPNPPGCCGLKTSLEINVFALSSPSRRTWVKGEALDPSPLDIFSFGKSNSVNYAE